jgi:hypothetical protein
METARGSGASRLWLIRDEQMQAFANASATRFRQKARRYLRAKWTEACEDLSDAELEERIDAARLRAEGFGISRQAHVIRFIEFGLLLGADFDRLPEHRWAARILDDEGRSGALKIVQLASGVEQVLARTRAGVETQRPEPVGEVES